MGGIHHYGHRDRAERTPGSHDAFMAACALAALAVGCGLVVGAGLLDGLVFAGAPPSLRHRSLPQIVAQVFTHAKHPYRAFAPAATGPVTSPWAYWVMFALLAVIVAARQSCGGWFASVGGGARPMQGSPRPPPYVGSPPLQQPPRNEPKPGPIWPAGTTRRRSSSATRWGGPSPPGVSPCEARGSRR